MKLTRRVLVLAIAATFVAASPSFAADRTTGDAGGLPALIRNARPSVLLIGTYGETDSPRFLFRGTGFVVAANNLTITNAHVLPDVVEDDPSPRRLIVQVATPGTVNNKWTQREVQVLKIDREHDLALLKVEGPSIPALPLADEQVAQEGASVAFMGFPIGGALGFSLVTHRGTISSIAPIALPQAGAQALNEKFIRQLRQGTFNILQLDATAYPGNSGGPVLDMNTGAVVGVINMVLIKGARETALSHPSGISYAIPVESVKRLLVRPE